MCNGIGNVPQHRLSGSSTSYLLNRSLSSTAVPALPMTSRATTASTNFSATPDAECQMIELAVIRSTMLIR